MRVIPVPVRSDNYAYLLIDDSTKKAAAIDPYDTNKVAEAAEAAGVQLEAVITTHHHADHSGGNEEFVKAYPGVAVYGGSYMIPALTREIKDKDEFPFGSIYECDSICFYVEDKKTGQRGVFTGDTLFMAGCGRFFEGTATEMHKALLYLGSLPDDTIVYNGHEYTSSSVAFGAHIDPENAAIKKLQAMAEEEKVTTGKTTIGDEKQWNVFMRLDTVPVQKATGLTDPVRVMDKLREMKNSFRS
ncbi:hypothetical protein BS47DRAFT_1374234 [Hydnum rufescens UP504]|uniref:hydroxyacylglutathione hydrolase n=1 Tax=Hydnum rufescens UP504 TaxID=1448309 RepID=A0A9P6DPQ8_9AGAM|nr:hypothetical protein BS47DRAFT_1374234 [Hydnum rufescens UP504]